jgi:hypothetical protein
MMANSDIGRAADSYLDASSTDHLLNEYAAADRLGLSVKTLRRWRWAGRPPAFVKIGNAVRYDPKVIASLIEAGRRTSTSDPGEDVA